MIYFLQSLILVSSLTTDAFAAALSYGANKIKIEKIPLVIVSLICSAMLLISMTLGMVGRVFIPEIVAKYSCFIILFLLGFTRLFDLILKSYIKNKVKVNFEFSWLSLNFILTVYADAKLADIDNSHSLSRKEAVSLAIALSLDSLAVGFGVATGNLNLFLPVLLSFIFTLAAVKLGVTIGSMVAKSIKFNLSYISAILLIILAFMKL